MKIDIKDYSVSTQNKINLKKWQGHCYIVPADNKKNARLIISKIIFDTFNKLKMSYSKTSPKSRSELQVIRKGLEK